MISGERNQFISAHLRPAVKEALQDETHSRGISMSLFISEAVEEKLRREGVLIIDPEPVEVEPALPFEEVKS